MKKILFILALTLISITTFGMSYERARENALFLTDKMAYELDLTEEQYEAAYEVNLDYLMGINTPDDVYAEYWRRRNIDLSYILFDWQYTRFCAIDYFYRPLYWHGGYWHFGHIAHTSISVAQHATILTVAHTHGIFTEDLGIMGIPSIIMNTE